MRIAVTASKQNANYYRWFSDANDINITLLDYESEPGCANAYYNGIIFTGGEDIDPYYYAELEKIDTSRQSQPSQRDNFEMQLLESAIAREIPILGICRGLQLVNVYLGGSLIQDVPQIGKIIHHKIDNKEQYHNIRIKEGSILHKISNKTECIVNSAHHQAVAKLGRGLIATSYSDDDIIESIEWAERINNFWMLLVQWHPERLGVVDMKLSQDLKNEFLKACSEK